MSNTEICRSITENIGALFECSVVGDYTRIRTPWIFPDGDVIDVFCRESRGTLLLTDLGETSRWLHNQTWLTRLSPGSLELMREACESTGITFDRGMLIGHCKEIGALADVLFRLTQAAIRVSDVSYTFKPRSERDPVGEVESFLEREGFQFFREPPLRGEAKLWYPDLLVLGDGESYVHVLAPANKGSMRTVLEHTVTMWHDCKGAVNGHQLTPTRTQLISLFDDTRDKWHADDIALAKSLSRVCLWSNQDGLIEALRKVA